MTKELIAAGFSSREIDDYKKEQQELLKQAGFSDEEIKAQKGLKTFDNTDIKNVIEKTPTYAGFINSMNSQLTEDERGEPISTVGEKPFSESAIVPKPGEPSFKESFTEGVKASVTGMIYRDKVPEDFPQDVSIQGRIANQLGVLVGDLPFMVAGAVGGSGGGPLTAMGGAFALPAGLRKVLIDKYEKGEVVSFQDFWSRVVGASWETIKGEGVGIATGGAGKIPGIGKLPAEIVTMISVGSALEGVVPEPKDFLDASIILGGLKGSVAVAGRLRKGYSKSGKKPSSYYDEIKEQPSINEKLQSTDHTEVNSAGEFIRRSPGKGDFISEPQKKSQITQFISEKLGVPIKVGVTRKPKGVRGFFKQKEEVIRIRLADDIETISHEVGHKLQKKIPELSSEQLEQFKSELEPIATKTKKGQPKVDEGLAEFVRLFLTDKKIAQKKAPKFYKKFNSLLKEEYKDTYNVLTYSRELYNKWIEQPSYMRVLSQISIGEQRTTRRTFDELYTATIDDLHPLKTVVDKMKTGEDLPASKDPYKLARLMRGWHGKAEHFLEVGTYDFNTYANKTKPLKAILEPIKNLDELRVYIASKRAQELSKRGIKTGFSKEDIAKQIKDLEPKYKQAFKDLKEFQNASLEYLRDSGILSKKAFEQMKNLNKDYIPFYRVMEDSKKVGGKGAGLEGAEPIKKIKGSEREIHDPLESIIKNTYLYISLAEKNAIGRSLVDLAESKHGMGQFVEKIPQPLQKTLSKKQIGGLEFEGDAIEIFRKSPFIPEENVISVWKDGKRELYEVDPAIARTFKSLDREMMPTLIKVLSYPAKLLRAGATLSPDFIARNPFRDQFSAFINSNYGYTPGFDLIKGVFSVVKKDKAYSDFLKSGAQHSMLVSFDRSYLQKNLAAITMDTPVRNVIKNPLEALRILSELSEQGTRIGALKTVTKKLGRGKQALQEAAFESREISLDFARMGAKTKAVNSLIAFWNANVQGTDKLVRQLKEHPVRTTAKIAASVTIPSVLLTIVNRKDERWESIPQWQKDLFWIIMTESHVWRIPKPFEIGVIFGSTAERATEYILDRDPKAFDGLLNSIGRGMFPGTVPTVAIPLIENYANKSLFLDRPIIPSRKEGILPEYQYNNYTTELTKSFSRLLGTLPGLKRNPNIAPAKVENLIRGWSGGVGMYMVKGSDYLLRKTGVIPDPIKPTATLADMPIIKAFMVRHPGSSENINNFFDNFGKAQQIQKTIKSLEGELLFKEAAVLMRENQEAMVKLDSIKKAILNGTKFISLINQNQNMSPDEKRQLIDLTYMQIDKIAKEGNKVYKKINQTFED